MLVNSMAKRGGLGRVVRNGAFSLPLSSKHRRTLLTGWEFFSRWTRATRILSSQWCLVKLEGKQCET